jgi:hypothetical protein
VINSSSAAVRKLSYLAATQKVRNPRKETLGLLIMVDHLTPAAGNAAVRQ